MLAVFFMSCTKNADMVWKASSSRPVQFLGKPGVEEAGGNLVAEAFEEAEVPPGEGHAAHAVADDHQPQKFIAHDHRHADAVAALAELLRMTLAEGFGPFFGGGVDIDGFVAG